MNPHAFHFVYSLNRSLPEATTLRAVQACAGRLGAAPLSPSGALASFEAARQEAL